MVCTPCLCSAPQVCGCDGGAEPLCHDIHRPVCLQAGLTKPAFEKFPELFLDRLLREALSICQLADEQSEHLAALVMLLGESIHISPGSDRSVQAHINDVARELDWMARDIGYLPEQASHEFNFGLRVNQTLRKRKGDKDYFYPLEELRGFWLGLLGHVASRPDNVVPLR